MCAHNVEKALLKLPGVHHVVANTLNSTATVHYDETQVTLAQLQAAVTDCGYVCAGEALPDHMAHTQHAQPAISMDRASHAGHTTPTLHASRQRGASVPMEHAAHTAASPLEDHSAHGGKPGMTAAAMKR
ncbi:MAG: heavy-metal-associated domain-containing protein, partial [Chloroflexi bacterium]|nr:heavy-metal-associated domain-containing protein [Chloroflexota bacterium]